MKGYNSFEQHHNEILLGFHWTGGKRKNSFAFHKEKQLIFRYSVLSSISRFKISKWAKKKKCMNI